MVVRLAVAWIERSTPSRIWLALAASCLLVSVAAAVALILFKVPGSPLPSGSVAFGAALTFHVNFATNLWFAAMAAGLVAMIWRVGKPVHWLALALCIFGAMAMLLAPWTGAAAPALNNYFPLLDSPVFFAGAGLFSLGVLLPGMIAVASSGPADVDSDLRLVVRLMALTMLSAAASTLASAAELGGRGLDLHYAELVSWSGGHLLQFAYALLLVAAWLLAIPREYRDGSSLRRALRLAAILHVLFAVVSALLLHLMYPVDSVAFRKGFTILMSAGAWIAPAPLLIWIIWKVRQWNVLSRLTTEALFASAALFGLGCLLGALIRGDTAMVPAHYHGTVGGVTLALLLVLGQSSLLAESGQAAVRRSIHVYALGMLTMVLALAAAGFQGWPRKLAWADLASLGASAVVINGTISLGGALAVGGAGWLAYASLRRVRRATPVNVQAPMLVVRRRADLRWRAAALTISGVLLAGSALSAWRQQSVGSGPSLAAPKAVIDRVVELWPTIDGLSYATESFERGRRQEIDARFSQGVVMLHAREYQHALTAFHRVLALAPDMPEAYVNIGYALVGLEQWQGAADFFEAATLLSPEQANAYHGMAIAYEGLGELEAAIGAMRTYLHRTPATDLRTDPHRRKAEAALWEWQDQLRREREAPSR